MKTRGKLVTLVLGGYGNFGARICRALAHDPSIDLVIGGRSLAQAKALAASLGGGASGVALDHGAPRFVQALEHLGVQLLIHTAGPFQQQGYAVAGAAVAAGAHYIDLADGRRFVCDFPAALNARFAAAGLTAVCGASTVPALSSAVIEALAGGWRAIDSIDICIAPAQTAPRGRATLAGVLSYCGEPIQVWDGGRWQTRHGWARPERVDFARIRPRLNALCDIPDLEIFPSRYGVTGRVTFRAALEVGLTQRVFALLAGLRSRHLLPPLASLAGVLNATAPWLDFLGTPVGGMVVRVTGADACGRAARRAWHITAGNDHGPEIPCMAAILLARRLARSEVLPAGAMTAAGLLALDDFTPEFARWGMATEVVEEAAEEATIREDA